MKQEAPILETVFAAALALTAAAMTAPSAAPPPVIVPAVTPVAPAITTAASPEPCHAVFCPGDYPEAALRARQEGTVVAIVEADRTGKPVDCRIATSSGHKLLDDATCPILIERQRYSPMKNKAGAPIRQQIRHSFQWKID